MSEPIAIVGMGCRFAGSPHLLKYWQTVRDGATCFSDVPEDRWRSNSFFSPNRRSPNHTYSRRFGGIGDIRRFAPGFFGISPARARQMDPQQRLFLEVTRCALEDAGYAQGSPNPERTGVFLGISTCEHRDYLSARLRLRQMLDGDFGDPDAILPSSAEELVKNVPSVQPSALVGQMLNMAAANVAQAFDFRGPAFAIDAACSSALVAVQDAMLHLRSRQCDVAVAGGVYLNLTPDNFIGFSRVGALSRTGACRPLDAGADGFVLGEGAGALVLRRLDDAIRDRDAVWAVLRGAGTSNDGRSGGPLAPSVEGQVSALRQAYADADVPPESVGFIEIHGTGTRLGDQVEVAALRRVMGASGAECYLSSAKANVGHTLAAAGAASLIRATLALAKRQRPPQASLTNVNKELSLQDSRFRVSKSVAGWEAEGLRRRAGVSAFGFGGTNVHLILEEAPDARRRHVSAASGSPGPARSARIVVGGPTRELLAQHLIELSDALRSSELGPIEDIAHTLRHRSTAPLNVSICAADATELADRLEIAASVQRGEDVPGQDLDWLAGPETADSELPAAEQGQARLCALPPSRTDERVFWALKSSRSRSGSHDTPEVLTKVIAVVAEVASVSSDRLTSATRIGSELGLDSLAVVELVEALARAFPDVEAAPESLMASDPSLERLARFVATRPPAGRSTIGAHSVPAGAKVILAATDPRVNAHRIDGVPILPLAAALDIALDAALGADVAQNDVARDAAGCRVRDFNMSRPVHVTGERVSLTVTCRRARAGLEPTDNEIDVVVGADAEEALLPAYRCRIERSPGPFESLQSDREASPPVLGLADFYRRHMFHDPPLRAIEEIGGIGERHVVGKVRSASSGSLRGKRVDWLALDGALQLCAYWVRSRLGKAALPVGFDELRILRAIPAGQVLHCVSTLSRIDDSHFAGDLDLGDEGGAPFLQVRGLRGRLLDSWGLEVGDVPFRGRIDELPEISALRERVQTAASQGITDPYFRVHEATGSDTARIAGREYVNFASYNYLGLSGDQEINRAALQAVERYGTSVSASRLASGERSLHRDLEAALADFLGCEDALVMVGGHATNVSVLGHLLGPRDVVVHDALAHDSILAGVRQARARRRAFPHNDMAALDRILGEQRLRARRLLVAVEGAYSMDGDLVPLDELTQIARRHGALTFVDEAHSLGAVGPTGRGVGELFGVDRRDVDVWMGTLSKSLASCGGYVAGTRALIDYLRYTTPGFVYSVGISPANAAAALAAVRKLKREPDRVTRLKRNADKFLELCRTRGINTGLACGTPIVPCIVGGATEAFVLAQALFDRNVNVQPIVPPAVEEGQARLRFFVTSRHTDEQLESTADTLAEELARMRSGKRPANEHRDAQARRAAS